MANKYADNIRRIVGFDPTKSSLGDAQQKDSIAGKRGIGYMSTDGRSTMSASGHSGNFTDGTGTTLPEIPDGSLDEGFPPAFGQGSYIDPTNPLNSILTGAVGRWDIEDIFDGISSPHVGSPLGSGISGIGLGTGGSINELTGMTDCATGKGIALNYRNEGEEPPPGWTDADTPPEGYEWEQGFQYHDTSKFSNIVGIALGATLAEALMNQAGWISVIGGSIGTFVQMYIGNDPDYPAATWVAGYADYTHSGGSPPNNLIRVYVHTKSACTPVTTYCTLTGPASSYHPEDGVMTLTFNGDGGFQQHALEAPNDIIPSLDGQTISSLNFCLDGGTRFGTLAPAVNGGFMLYETDSEGGSPVGVVRVFSSDRQMVAATDITGMQAWMPPAP